MAYRVKFATTNKLSLERRQQIVGLFLNVFGKRMSLDGFEHKFTHTFSGFSYHGLLVHNDTVVGAFSAIPYRYKYFGKELTFALSVDTMIHPDHRGGGQLVEMAELVYAAMIDDGIPLILGFPNEYYYKHEKRLFGTKEISELDYYALPINIGAVLPRFRFANPISRSVSNVMAHHSFRKKQSTPSYEIEKIVDDQFETHRYDDTYIKSELEGGGCCVSKTYAEDGGALVTYILDVNPLTPTVFSEAVRVVYNRVKTESDMIMYVGKPPFSPPGLLKVPDAKKPQHIRMTGRILIPEVVDDSVFDIKNWNVNISNFDVR